MITSKKPVECSEIELADFAALVRAGGEVTKTGFDGRLKRAEALLFLEQDGCLQGIAAVKNPDKKYKEGVFAKAKSTIQSGIFVFELGWVFVLPSSRGGRLSYKLVEAAVSASKGQPIFATSRVDNIAMHKALKAYGFTCHGETYPSSRGQSQLKLFLHSGAQQGAPADAEKRRG
ncbi:hypothetical protein Thimo_0400 [Thioflavicoccus mobilis 8321]|uniref:N-acetyltransferase domain-containing protein n=1 Tax=Thioflavicoccus mobilis 8321 TaxID=765912 RepID=L0GR82_9GAMM|nr:hypothetical protein [Thioflavicoccus mobilis]AGA89263.1 hypothetical protein Thimo_0400 [Thioflavicoccus mobilis 8321]